MAGPAYIWPRPPAARQYSPTSPPRACQPQPGEPPATRSPTNALAAAADGRRLPFPTAAFDAIAHIDMLCCAPAKLAVLTETRRALRPHG
ncbi:MAG: class I SAM-dependent methyltransferase [Nocardioidaceae bacterium]